MVIVPQTNIILLKTPMELSDNNQLTWSNLNEQFNYFYNLPKLILDEATYQRKEGVIRFPTSPEITYEDLLQYNYCMYQNEAYDNKWFYAYITEINYVNDGMSTIKIETDVWNTWWNDVEFKESFIEREHVNDDTIGLNTIPETLETGEYIINESHTNQLLQSKCNILAVTKDYYFDAQGNFHMGGDNGGGVYGGVRTAYRYYLFDNTSSSKLTETLEGYAQAGESEAIGMMFTAPFWAITRHDTSRTDDVAVEDTLTPSTLYWNSDETQDPRIEKPNTLNGYTPKNNKLLTFPYQYFLMSNNNGGNAIYHYELFSTNYLDFTIKSVCVPGMSGIIIPQNYKGESENYNELLQMAKFPICGWGSDVYTNWLTQSSINRNVDIVKSASSGVITGSMAGFGLGGPGGAVVGGLIGGVVGLIGTTAQSVMEMKQHEFVPPQAQGNTNTGDVAYANGKCSFTYYKMSIREEYARIIDNYFSMYGYKVNSLKLPNISGRRNWNYVKTIGCNIIGDIPQMDLAKIKDLFDKGITLWHHTNTFLDYSQNNSII